MLTVLCVRLDWNEWKINNFTLDEEWELCVSRGHEPFGAHELLQARFVQLSRTQFSRSFFILITSEFPFPPVMCRKIYWSSWVGGEESWHWHSAKGTSNWSQSIFWTCSHAVLRSDEIEHFFFLLSLSAESFLSIFHQNVFLLLHPNLGAKPTAESVVAALKWSGIWEMAARQKKRDARVSTFGAQACTSAAADSFISCVQFMPVAASVIIVGREKGREYLL